MRRAGIVRRGLARKKRCNGLDNRSLVLKIIIIGAGQVGFHTARRLVEEHKDVVVIDKNPAILARLTDQLDVQALEGSGSSLQVLEEAGIQDADALLAVTDSDEINLVACSFANILAPNITKVVRLRNEDYLSHAEIIKKNFNVEFLINPEKEIVNAIRNLIGMPGASDSRDFFEGRIKLVSLWVDRPSLLTEGPLLGVRERVGIEQLIVAAIIRRDKIIIPKGQDEVYFGDRVYFICFERDLEKILKKFGTRWEKQKKVMIIGGGGIGLRLARALEKEGLAPKIVEQDKRRCEHLSENLDRSVVLHSQGDDSDMLLEENIGDVDVAVTVTGDEENNILMSLLAKSLGAKKTITRVNKVEYLPMVRRIGLESIVSPRISAVNSILRNMRGGRVISAVSIQEEADVLEASIEEGSWVVGKKIYELSFPEGAIVLSLARGDSVIIPTGTDCFQAGDRVLILATRKSIAKVEKVLTVKFDKP